MKNFKSIEKLANSFQKLPGIGHKTAEKMAFQILEMNEMDVKEFSDALIQAKATIKHCPICGCYTENEICETCASETRNKTKILVVSQAKDALAFEKNASFDGVYHVLGGVLNSVNGIGIDDLNISSLIERIKSQNVQEIIIATEPSIEGETTALYLAKILENTQVKVTRIAYGLPLGGHLEYADSLTLNKALEGRKKI